MTCTVTATSGLIEAIPNLPPDEVIFGNSPVMGRIRQKLEIAAASHISVLLRGQSGTGKELLVKLIHSQSSFLSAAQKLQARFRIPRLK
jgi:transcriptional regulator with PAS, ATPase and Fis domain